MLVMALQILCIVTGPVQFVLLSTSSQLHFSLGMRLLLGVMLCGLCTCLPCSSSWMPLHFRPARDLTYALGHARRPVPRCVRTTGGSLGRSTCAGRGPC